MKKAIIILMLSTTIAGPAYTEGFISLGGAGALLLEDPPPFAPDVRLQTGVDLYDPLDDQWSMFLSGTLLGFWRPVDQRFRYLYAAAYDVSWRGENLFLKASLKAKGEQLYAPVPGLPDRFDNSLEIHLAWDINDVTVFFTPQVSYNREDLLDDNVTARGEIGISFPLGERSVAAVKLKGSFTPAPLHWSTASLGAETTLSVYPDAPWFLKLVLGGLFQSSDYTEVVAAESVHRLTYYQIYVTAEFSALLSDAVLLKALMPARLSFKDMRAFTGGAFTGEVEWTLALGPEIELTLALASHHHLVFFLKGEPFFSNSDYYDAGYGECGIRYQLDF